MGRISGKVAIKKVGKSRGMGSSLSSIIAPSVSCPHSFAEYRIENIYDSQSTVPTRFP